MGNKVLKTILVTASLLLATTGIAGAEHINSVNYNYFSNKVEISGFDFDSSNGGWATILVMKDSDTKNFDGDSVEKQEQIKITDGKFSFEFALKGTPDEGTVYTAYVRAGNTDSATSFTYTKDIESVYDLIMGGTDDDFVTYANAKSGELILNDTVFGKLEDKEAALKIALLEKAAIAEKVEEIGGNKKQGIVYLREAILRASYIQALNEGKIDEVVTGSSFTAPEILGLDELSVTAYELYCTVINDTGIEKVLANIQKKGYKNLSDFRTDFIYQCTMAAIKYNNTSDGTDHVADILKDNNAVNKFDLTNYNSVSDTKDIDVLLLGKEWARDDIQGILDTEIEESGKDPEASGKNNSSSGSINIGGPGTYTQNYGQTETEPEPQDAIFTDLESVEWARPSIEGLASAGVVSGRGNGIYAPLDSVTRAEFLQMLVKALDIVVENPACSFPDVIEGEWYYNAIATGTTFGLASGYDNGYFGTTDLITRQDAAVMLNNAVTKSGKTLEAVNEGMEFADKAEISDYAADDVEILVKAGVLSGADGNFMPKSNATRAEAAVMISKIMSALGLEG